MTRTLIIRAALLLMFCSGGCVTHRTCSHQDMIGMKEKGFATDEIETMCTTRRFDSEAFGAMASGLATGIRAMAEVERLQRNAEHARSDPEELAAKLEALDNVLSRFSQRDQRMSDR